jgi:polysaccharide biosynthesis protein PslG
VTQTEPPPPPARKPALAVGIHYDCLTDTPAQRPKVFALLKEARVHWVRINTNWRALEPRRNRWSAAALRSLDDCVSLALESGLRIDLPFTSTPPWAGPDAHAPPTDPRAYAAAIGYLAHRYRGRVDAWEIWNEENRHAMWTGTPADYARLLKAAYPAVKSADPHALVVFGGTYGDDSAWVRGAYAAGAKGSFDVMATHPYVGSPSRAEEIHRIMVTNGDGETPVWFSEMGYSAPLRMGLAEQARRLTDLFSYTREHLPFVRAIFWFQIVGVNPNAPVWEHDLEIVSGDLRPRPAFYALKREAIR